MWSWCCALARLMSCIIMQKRLTFSVRQTNISRPSWTASENGRAARWTGFGVTEISAVCGSTPSCSGSRSALKGETRCAPSASSEPPRYRGTTARGHQRQPGIMAGMAAPYPPISLATWFHKLPALASVFACATAGHCAPLHCTSHPRAFADHCGAPAAQPHLQDKRAARCFPAFPPLDRT